MSKDNNSSHNEKRPPVVTVMGHVDHGKTTLIDAIRGSNITDKESGGITQNISAFKVNHKGRNITFIDTPGHELFSQMRKNGVLMTDLVLLVIAVDDGVMPQTKEVIDIIKENNLKTIVVFNKIDLPQKSNLHKIKSDLSREGILLEGFGGDIVSVEISAKNKQGIDELLELVFLQYDLLENTYESKEKDSLVILESYKDSYVGNVSLCLVEDGIVERGYNIFSLKRGNVGRIRAIKNDRGEDIQKASVADPIYIQGQNDFLDIGERVIFSKDKILRDIVKEDTLATEVEENLSEEDFFNESGPDIKKLSIILKTDTKGSMDAIVSAIDQIKFENISIDIFKKGLGDVSDEDINIAKNTHSIIIGFKIKVSSRLKKLAQNLHIIVMVYDIVYRLVDDLKDAAESLIPPEFIEIENGKMEVKEIFKLSNKSIVSGGVVFEGKILRNSKCKVIRGDEVIFEGKISDLRQLKNEVSEVATGTECGIILNPSFEPQNKDIIISYRVEKV